MRRHLEYSLDHVIENLILAVFAFGLSGSVLLFFLQPSAAFFAFSVDALYLSQSRRCFLGFAPGGTALPDPFLERLHDNKLLESPVMDFNVAVAVPCATSQVFAANTVVIHFDIRKASSFG